MFQIYSEHLPSETGNFFLKGSDIVTKIILCQLEDVLNPLNAELNPIYYLLALLVHDFLHVSRIRAKSLTLRLLMSYIYIYIYMTIVT